jgi:hypothetical protein
MAFPLFLSGTQKSLTILCRTVVRLEAWRDQTGFAHRSNSQKSGFPRLCHVEVITEANCTIKKNINSTPPYCNCMRRAFVCEPSKQETERNSNVSRLEVKNCHEVSPKYRIHLTDMTCTNFNTVDAWWVRACENTRICGALNVFYKAFINTIFHVLNSSIKVQIFLNRRL